LRKYPSLILFTLCFSQLFAQGNPPYSLNAEQLAWGQSQLERMLQDRPAMAKYTRKGDPLWKWTVRQFAGEWKKGGIEWDPSDPDPLWNASSFYGPEENRKGRIQVTARFATKDFHFGEIKTGCILWQNAIFELCNFKSDRKWIAIDQAAANAKIGKEEYCFRRLFLENFVTFKYIKLIFMNLWVPNCRKLSLKPLDEYRGYLTYITRPLIPPRRFIEIYFNIDYSNAKTKNSDIVMHHRSDEMVYENNVIPLLREKNLAEPTPMAMTDLKRKMLAEFVPAQKVKSKNKKIQRRPRKR
jgi:hypothetical protein